MKAWREQGYTCELLPSTATFSFANSQRSRCRECLKVWYGDGYFTIFDIVEEGRVPMLMSIIQMMNLNLQLTCHNGGVRVQSANFRHGKQFDLEFSTSGHAILDLTRITYKGDTSFVGIGTGRSYAQKDQKPPAEGDAEKGDPRPGEPSEIRATATGSPFGKENAPGKDVESSKRIPSTEEKTTATPPPPRTLEESEKPTAVSLPPSLLKLHRRLNSELELYKLHIKHYHMTPTRFKFRTSELALPDEIYEKYEKICKDCTHCQHVGKTAPRSHVSGIRSQNFGDLLFFDHCEVTEIVPGKPGQEPRTRKHIILIILDSATSYLSAYPCADHSDKTTLEKLRILMQENN